MKITFEVNGTSDIKALVKMLSSFDEHGEMAVDLSESVGSLGLTVRAENCLLAEDIRTIGDLIKLKKHDLSKIPNVGRLTRIEIMDRLIARGLRLAD